MKIRKWDGEKGAEVLEKGQNIKKDERAKNFSWRIWDLTHSRSTLPLKLL